MTPRLGTMEDENDEDDLEKVAKASVSLEGKDYLALAIASLETIFLPLLILAAVIIVITLLLR